MTNEQKVVPTDAQRIEALQKANPKMTRKEACELLGIKDTGPVIEMPEFFANIFKGKP